MADKEYYKSISNWFLSFFFFFLQDFMWYDQPILDLKYWRRRLIDWDQEFIAGE